MTAINRAEVDAALNRAERRFEKCWSYLVALKRGKFDKDRLAPLLKFQPLLATALFSLSRLDSKIAEERQARITNKGRYDRSWFAARMAFLDRQRQLLAEAIQIGRSIGDAYAWFFYQNELELLRQHVQEPKPGVMSVGMGGIGELQCARNMQSLGDHFVVHHCITSILRLGDVTLINMNGFKVAGIGELKSHSEKPGVVTVSISILGDAPRPKSLSPDPENVSLLSQTDLIEGLNDAAKARLRRQIKRIQGSHEIARKQPDHLLSIESDSRAHCLERLINSVRPHKVAYILASDGLLMFAYRDSQLRLAERLRRNERSVSKRFMHGLNNMPDQVLKIVLKGRSDNSILINWFFYHEDGHYYYLPGMTHPFWWPISPRTLKAVIFKRAIVGSVYNPVWLFKQLEDAGFHVEASDARNPKITRQTEHAMFHAENSRFYLSAIQDYLMTESAVVQMLTCVFESLQGDPPRRKGRVDLRFYQKFGTPNLSDGGGAPRQGSTDEAVDRDLESD